MYKITPTGVLTTLYKMSIGTQLCACPRTRSTSARGCTSKSNSHRILKK